MTFTTADRQDYTQHLVQLLRFTTSKRALPRSAVPSWLLVHKRLRDIFCMPALFWLWPRLFRGVTPDRHAGETSLAVVHNWLAHSSYPLDLDTESNPRTAAAHVPYTVLLTTTPAQVTVGTRGVI